MLKNLYFIFMFICCTFEFSQASPIELNSASYGEYGVDVAFIVYGRNTGEIYISPRSGQKWSIIETGSILKGNISSNVFLVSKSEIKGKKNDNYLFFLEMENKLVNGLNAAKEIKRIVYEPFNPHKRTDIRKIITNGWFIDVGKIIKTKSIMSPGDRVKINTKFNREGSLEDITLLERTFPNETDVKIFRIIENSTKTGSEIMSNADINWTFERKKRPEKTKNQLKIEEIIDGWN